jgi:hypothetical protein
MVESIAQGLEQVRSAQLTLKSEAQGLQKNVFIYGVFNAGVYKKNASFAKVSWRI